MNLLGYTSTSLLREEQALNAKLRDSNEKLHGVNRRLRAEITALKKQLENVSNSFETQRTDYLKCIKEKKLALSEKAKLIKQMDSYLKSNEELVEQLEKTNDRYDAFVTVTGTNFAAHFDRVLKKRKVEELTLD